MQTSAAAALTLSLPPATPRRSAVQLRPSPKGAPIGPVQAERERRFADLMSASRSSGGLLRGDEVADLLARRRAADLSRLARWIVTRKVLSFDWHGELWLPMCQFRAADMQLIPEVADIIADRGQDVDSWMLASWFFTPHRELSSRRPADVLPEDAAAVRRAAAGDFFLDVGA